MADRRRCGKIPHPTKATALTAMAVVSGARGSNFGQLQVYRCSKCWINRNGNRQRAWHFGHDSHRVRRSR